MESFLKQNSLLLMNHIEIVMRLVEEEKEDDGQYDVWQSVYFVKDFQRYEILRSIQNSS